MDVDRYENPLYGGQEGVAQFGDCEGGYYGWAMSTALSVDGRYWSRLWNDTRREEG